MRPINAELAASYGLVAGTAFGLPDAVRAALLGLVSALLAWLTSWVLNRIKRYFGG